MRLFSFSLIVLVLMSTIVISSRIDNLNIVENSAIYVQDITNPVINNITFTNFANNSFASATRLNITYNVSDAYNNSILFYVNSIKNGTFGYISNSSQIATLTIATDGNYSILFEANDSANNKLNSSFLYLAVDTVTPSSSAYRNVSVAGGEIRANTNVNVSLNISDIYMNNITISHNASGTLSNNLLTQLGNTTYHYIIGSGNFTANQVVGWNATAFDLAGNKLETSTFTFLVNAVPSSGGSLGGAQGGGGGAYAVAASQCQPYAQAFKKCYNYDVAERRCVVGCVKGYTCDEFFQCLKKNESVVVQSIVQGMQNVVKKLTMWEKLKSFFSGLFSTESPLSAVPLPSVSESSAMFSPDNEAGDSDTSITSQNIKEKAKDALANPYVGLVFVGIIGTILAFIQFNVVLFTNPTLILPLAAYWLVVLLFYKFKILGGG